MKNICTINLNEGEGRQTISWNPEDGMLYSSACEEPVDGYTYDSFEDAVNACDCMWGCAWDWELEWIESDED